jgi:uncharacterized protein (TIGR02217 family)
MAFHETRISDAISYGSSGGPGFRTDIIRVDSGAEYRVARWANALRTFTIHYQMQDLDDLYALTDFFMARQGATHGFRYKDFSDFTTASNGTGAHAFDDVDLGVGDGSETQFQLKKLYAPGTSWERSRAITKPVSGTVKIGIDDVEQASGWSVDTTTGIVTFSSAPAIGEVVQGGCEFDVPVRFGEDADTLFSTVQDAYNTGSIADIQVTEIKDAGEIHEEMFYGGAKDWGQISASVSLAVGEGLVQTAEPTTTGVKAHLPGTTSLQLGGPYFIIKNESGSQSLEITKDGGATTVRTLAAGEGCFILLGTNATADKLWMAV